MNWRHKAVVVLLLVVVCLPASARPISFAPGTTSGTVRGTAFGGATDIWTLRARKGQTMHVRLLAVDGEAHFDVAPPGESLLAQNKVEYEGRLGRTGTYTISVYTESVHANYHLVVTLK